MEPSKKRIQNTEEAPQTIIMQISLQEDVTLRLSVNIVEFMRDSQ